jgi:nucleoid DNA-binding protein
MAPMTLLVCLCGAPLSPEIGGVRPVPSPDLELMQLLDGLKNSHAWLTDHYDGDLVLAAAEADLATAESIQALADQLKALERLAGQRIAQQTPSRKSPRGRCWAPPKRKPASGDVLTLDTLVIALQEIGLTARVAKKAVKAIFEGITNWLQDGEIAETPLGVFEFARRPAERTLVRLGRSCKFNTQPKRVVFRPSPALQAACNRSIPREIPVPNVNIQPIHPNQLQCEKCGSSHFVEGHFKQYRQYYSASPGAEISPITEDPVRALVCTCGHPIPPGQLRSYRRDDTSFRKSLEAARQYRERTAPAAILRRIVGPYATRSQHDDLVERINKLGTILKEPLPPSPRQPSNP